MFDHPYTFIRNPNRPLIVDDMPALVQWDGGETVLDQFAGAPQLRMTVSVEVFDATKDDGAALNEGFAQPFEAVIPTGNTILGGLAMNVRRGDMRDPETEQDEGKGKGRIACSSSISWSITGPLRATRVRLRRNDGGDNCSGVRRP